MSCGADINRIVWQGRLSEAVIPRNEVHLHPNCRYEMGDQHPVLMGRIKVYLLIRVCVCGKKINKKHFMDKGFIHLEAIEDGVEAHLTEACCYEQKRRPDGQIELQKVCYCPRDLQQI